ncbi:response regulator transcription factor [Paeniglutamicibacter sp. R2-26]|uniref:helix-turn-helix transcriptional regulator n=1 Tax=Paeniglutamicibacter sp. R2-26 TaxID=3144417 RepID=UPI003EE81CA9
MNEVNAWRPNFGENANANGEVCLTDSFGGKPRDAYIDKLKSVLEQGSATALVMLGEHGDDRVALLALAQRQLNENGDIIHVVGTTYAQRIEYGALGFLLADVETSGSLGPADVARSFSKVKRRTGGRPVVVVQHPQLLDEKSRAVLSQMAHNRSILLVVLAVHAEFLPAEFVPLCDGPGYHELVVDPYNVHETHQALIDEFGVVPTPVTTAEMWRRSQGNPGWLEALALDAFASGKLAIRRGHLSTEKGDWPHGARVESMGRSQISILDASERKFIQRLAVSGSLDISQLAANELACVDHLIGWGLVQRLGGQREAIVLTSRLLEDVLRSETRAGSFAPDAYAGSEEGNFYAFISDRCHAYEKLAASGIPRNLELCHLLRDLRVSLLDGELGDAEQAIHQVLPGYFEELPAELFEVVSVAEAILNVASDRFHQAQPVLEAMFAQLEESEATYDLWLIRSMRNYVQDMDDPSRHSPLPFPEIWDPGRWWFTELLASPETTWAHESRMPGGVRQNVSQREVLEALVGLRHGFQPPYRFSDQDVEYRSTRSGTALALMASGSDLATESGQLSGLEAMIDAGLVVFALPGANQVVERLSPPGKSLVASWVNRRRKSAVSRSETARDDVLDGEYPLLEVLTRREKFVATAAARGLNNQQIAKNAGVSIRTVEGHLYQIYSKLAIGGRRELSSMVATLENRGSARA